MLNRKSILSLLPVLILFAIADSAAAVEPVEVRLEGHDQPVRGFLRQISDARYLLQGTDVYYELTADQIVSVDGNQTIPRSVRGSGRLVFSSFYEKLLPDGSVEFWDYTEATNDGSTFWTGTSWGAAAHEADEARHMTSYDVYGNELPMRLVPRDDGGFRVEVDFLVPVAPGERTGLIVKVLRKGAVRHEGDTWSYTYNGDFAEDRHLTRKIELPAGAELIDTYTGSRRVELGDRIILVSQRYYPAHTKDPVTVTFRLP